MKIINRFINDDSGASMIEYALLVALIAIVAIIALQTVGGKVSDAFDAISAEL